MHQQSDIALSVVQDNDDTSLSLSAETMIRPSEDWQSLVARAIPRPESAAWLMFTDLLFFADFIPFLWPFLVIPGFIVGAGGVLAAEKIKGTEPGQALLRALLAGFLVVLPTPVLGTLSGTIALLVRMSGWSPEGDKK